MKYILLLLFFISLYSCANLDPNENPTSQFDSSDRYGELKSDTLYAIEDTVYMADNIGTGTSENLALADLGGLKAGFFIKLTTLPDTLDKTIGVQLDFRTSESYGPVVPDSVAVDIFAVDREWSSLEVNIIDDFRNNPPTDLIGTLFFKTNDSMRTRYTFDMDRIRQWVEDEESNNGLFFRPQQGQGDFAVNVGALGSSIEPQLIITSDLDSLFARDTISVGPDASLFTLDVDAPALQRDTEEMLISSGIPNRTLLKFDLSGLPEKALFYTAYVSIKEAGADGYSNPEKAGIFRLRNVISASADFSTLDIDSTFVSEFDSDFLLEQTSTSEFALQRGFQKRYFAENFLQPFVNGTLQHEWFLIHYADEAEDISVKKYYSAHAANRANRPMLIVNYLNGK